MASHWGGLISKGVLAALFLLTLSGVAGLFALFWAHPNNDAGRLWLVQWRPFLMRTMWTQTPAVSADQVLSQLERGERVWLVDVREREERLVSMLPGAMSLEQFERRRKNADVGQVVAYCTVGLRSGDWVDQMRDTGLDAVNLTGGVLGWTHAGGPVWDQGQDSRRIHVYSEYWSLAPDGFEMVW
jgi:rhodanese-related sulfurtransferase